MTRILKYFKALQKDQILQKKCINKRTVTIAKDGTTQKIIKKS